MKYRYFWLGGGGLLVVLVWYLSLTGKPPDMDLGLEYQDKLKHAFAYASLSLWFCQLYLSQRSRGCLIGLLILMGVSIEILQGLGGERMFEYADMLANTVGVLLGLWLVHSPLGTLFVQLEKMYEKHGNRK